MNKTRYAKNIYWVFGILLKKNSKIKRNKIMKNLLNLKIETRPFFLSMNQQKIFKTLKIFRKDSFKNSDYLSKNGFYLPSGIGITNKEINFVAKEVLKLID